MKVLCNFSHETRLNLLSELDHDFYIPHDQAQNHDTVREDYLMYFSNELVPENLHFDETPDDPDVIIKGENADINFLQGLRAEPDPKAITFYRTETMIALHPPKDSWYWIGRGVDIRKFQGWTSNDFKDRPVITVGNNLMNGKRFDQGQIKKVKDELGDRFKIYGKNNGTSFVPHNTLPRILKECAIYVNFSDSPGANSMLEAMATGCPIVSIPGLAIEDFITNGYNGYITSDILKGIAYFYDHPPTAIMLGRLARQKAIGKYNKGEWLARWENALQVIGNASG